jgi:hypothetical protein
MPFKLTNYPTSKPLKLRGIEEAVLATANSASIIYNLS